MNYHEIRGDLFENIADRYIVQCVSADFEMGAGIAREIGHKYAFTKDSVDAEIKAALRKQCSEGHGGLYCYMKILCLVTKQYYWHKPTYTAFQESLDRLKKYCVECANPPKLVMPRIGCGLDKLNWNKVRVMILNTFVDTDIDILVCHL